MPAETIETVGLGFAPASRDALKSYLLQQGFRWRCWCAGGLGTQRDGGTTSIGFAAG